MTIKELLDNLEKYSPFKFEGGNEKYDFKNNNEIHIDDKLWTTYEITDTDTGLHINNSGLMPFQKNVLVDFKDKVNCIIVNHDGNKLIKFPDNLRHSASVGGFFILKSIDINK